MTKSRMFYGELLDREKVRSCFDCIYCYFGGSRICYVGMDAESYKEAEKYTYHTLRDKITT